MSTSGGGGSSSRAVAARFSRGGDCAALLLLAQPVVPVRLATPAADLGPVPDGSRLMLFSGTTALELQQLVSSCRQPTTIDLGGRDVVVEAPPPRGALPASSASDSAWLIASVSTLNLDRDNVTLCNGRLVLRGSHSTLHVSGRDVVLRGIDVVEEPATPMPMPSRQQRSAASAFVVEDNGDAFGSGGADDDNVEDEQAWPLMTVMGGSLLLDGCRASAAPAKAPSAAAGCTTGRDLVQCFSTLHMRYCRLSGGNNGIMAVDGAHVLAECCTLTGYSGVGLLAVGCTARLVGCRLVGSGGAAAKGMAANAGASLSAVGCSIEAHSRVEVCCSVDSRAELVGCVVGLPGGGFGPAVGCSGRAVLRNCSLENELYVVGGHVDLHACTLAPAGEHACGGTVRGDQTEVNLVACSSAGGGVRPVSLVSSPDAHVHVTCSPSVFVQVGRC